MYFFYYIPFLFQMPVLSIDKKQEAANALDKLSDPKSENDW